MGAAQQSSTGPHRSRHYDSAPGRDGVLQAKKTSKYLLPSEVHCFLDSVSEVTFTIEWKYPKNFHFNPENINIILPDDELPQIGLLFALCDKHGHQRRNLEHPEVKDVFRIEIDENCGRDSGLQNTSGTTSGSAAAPASRQKISRNTLTFSLHKLPPWCDTIVIGTQPAERNAAHRYQRAEVTLRVAQDLSFEDLQIGGVPRSSSCADADKSSIFTSTFFRSQHTTESSIMSSFQIVPGEGDDEQTTAGDFTSAANHLVPALDEPIALAILHRDRKSTGLFTASSMWKLHSLGGLPIPSGLSLQQWLTRQVYNSNGAVSTERLQMNNLYGAFQHGRTTTTPHQTSSTKPGLVLHGTSCQDEKTAAAEAVLRDERIFNFVARQMRLRSGSGVVGTNQMQQQAYGEMEGGGSSATLDPKGVITATSIREKSGTDGREGAGNYDSTGASYNNASGHEDVNEKCPLVERTIDRDEELEAAENEIAARSLATNKAKLGPRGKVKDARDALLCAAAHRSQKNELSSSSPIVAGLGASATPGAEIHNAGAKAAAGASTSSCSLAATTGTASKNRSKRTRSQKVPEMNFYSSLVPKHKDFFDKGFYMTRKQNHADSSCGTRTPIVLTHPERQRPENEVLNQQAENFSPIRRIPDAHPTWKVNESAHSNCSPAAHAQERELQRMDGDQEQGKALVQQLQHQHRYHAQPVMTRNRNRSNGPGIETNVKMQHLLPAPRLVAAAAHEGQN
ncbi:unnamed protein product [Amoebophrya sp. A120]|nr:unnamed protein product [Amoebophrya sp. A120]|eukprot:GSA120T00014283001.1